MSSSENIRESIPSQGRPCELLLLTYTIYGMEKSLDSVCELVPFVSKSLEYLFDHLFCSFADCPVRETGALDPFEIIGAKTSKSIMILLPKTSI